MHHRMASGERFSRRSVCSYGAIVAQRLNVEADALSRLSQGASIPASLVNATCLPVSPSNDASFRSLDQVSCRTLVPTHCLELCVLASFACGRETSSVLFARTA